jgi:hypothetical protein
MRMKKQILYCGLVFFILLMSYPKLTGVHQVNENLIKPVVSQKIAKCLVDQMVQVDDDETLNVIVVTKSDVDLNLIRNLEAGTGKLDIRKIYNVLPSFQAQVTPNQINVLAADDRIKAIEWGDLKGNLYLGDAQAASNTDDLRSPTGYNLTGSGVTVALIDSGIWTEHDDLDDGQLIGFKDIWGEANSDNHTDFTTPIEGVDNEGHGTAMAGIIAGSGDGDYELVGLAPKAKLIAVRLLNDSAEDLTYSNAYDALQWVGDNSAKYGIDVVSCSWGFERAPNWDTGPNNDTLAHLADYLVKTRGLVVIAGAGNQIEIDGIATPASSQYTITVGAVKDPNEGGWSWFGNNPQGPANYTDESEGWYKPDVLAPGVNINCTSRSDETGYAEMSGTSPATAFVAGMVALYLEHAGSLANNGGANPTVKELLKASAVKVSDDSQPGIDNKWGSGRVDGLVGLNFYNRDVSSQASTLNFTASYSRDNEPSWSSDRSDWYRYPATSDFDITVNVVCDLNLWVKVILYRGDTQVSYDESKYRGNDCYISHTGYTGSDYYIEISIVLGNLLPKGYPGGCYDIDIDLTSY